MPVKDSKTEQLIKETARYIFLKEGKMLATTQDIADAAGVNRTLLHYYFRSRDALFNEVFKEALLQLREGLYGALGLNEPFKRKIESMLEVYFQELHEAPYLETFIVLQINQDRSKYEEFFIKIPGSDEKLKRFLKEIQQEMDKGTIPNMKPIQYYMSIFGLMAHPLLTKPIYQNIFQLSDDDFDKVFKERKKVIMTLLFNN
jgi:TetR/AcrR family transcriptional regulator